MAESLWTLSEGIVLLAESIQIRLNNFKWSPPDCTFQYMWISVSPPTGSRSLEKKLPFSLRKSHNSLKTTNLIPPAPLAQVVYLKDIVCYLSLLERGRAEDKLECKCLGDRKNVCDKNIGCKPVGAVIIGGNISGCPGRWVVQGREEMVLSGKQLRPV